MDSTGACRAQDGGLEIGKAGSPVPSPPANRSSRLAFLGELSHRPLHLSHCLTVGPPSSGSLSSIPLCSTSRSEGCYRYAILLQVQWLVKPLRTPRPWLRCSRCDARTPFISSDKFRVNAQKKRIDAWLVYRCVQCDQSWNFPVPERCPVNGIEPTILRALTENDSALAGAMPST